jgi:hypothetical protein
MNYLKEFNLVFMAFYAIFWGATFNVQGRWKPFQLPLFGLKKVRNRVMLSYGILMLLPIIYFAIILCITRHICVETNVLNIVILGVVPAFGIFGIYRLWVGLIELFQDSFYYYKDKIDIKYMHVEPAIGQNDGAERDNDCIYLGDKKSGIANILWASGYIAFGILIPLLYMIFTNKG